MSLLIFFIIFSLTFSFICSLGESVLLSLTNSHIEKLINEKKKSGRILKRLKSNIDKPLSSILIINTIANTVGAVGIGAKAVSIFGSDSLILVSTLMTVSILIFSEIVPKSIGAYYWKSISPFMAYVLKWFTIINTPLLKITELITTMLKPSETQPKVSREDMKIMAEIARDEGQFTEKEVEVLHNLMFMGTLDTQGILTPRTVMFTLPGNMLVSEFIADEQTAHFSRIPLYQNREDDIGGFILKTDILLAAIRGETDKTLNDYIRPIQAVPETIRLSDLFYILVDKKRHLVIVVDEYGAVAGIVTLEDIIEYLIGREIMDESDNVSDLRGLAIKKWRMKRSQHKVRNEIMNDEAEDEEQKE